MDRRWFILGLCAFVLLSCIIFPHFFGIPWNGVFGSDAVNYSLAANNILTKWFFSLDGVHPFSDREPLQSVLLAFIYFLFGVENFFGLFFVQGLLLLSTTWFFSRELSAAFSKRVGGFAFLLILTSGSILRSVFSAYRECLALCLLMVAAGLWLRYERRSSAGVACGVGLSLGLTILTYYPFVLFPFLVLGLWFLLRRSKRHGAVLALSCMLVLSFWGLRNFLQEGNFHLINQRRSHITWFIRGVQAKELPGFLPAKCLYAEYVSRNWEGLPESCSFNALMHTYWPDEFDYQIDYSASGRAGLERILEHPLSYLSFSLFEIIELHIPYVGGGWSTSYHLYALLTQMLLYGGTLIALPLLRDRRMAFLSLLMLYTTLVFIVADATPRYLVPILFSYAAYAALGYHRLLQKFLPHL